MGNRYLIVSDLHLTDVEDHDDGWKAYKSSGYLFDDKLDALVQEFLAEGEGGDKLTLILNGDIFDFDLVTAVPDEPLWPVSRAERRRGLDPTAEKSAWKLDQVLAHHPLFLATLAHFIGQGHRVVYVMGNHDRELHFPEVQAHLTSAIEDRARELGTSLLRGSIEFEPWFYYVPGEVYVEHGHQYDYYTSFRYLLSPTLKREGEEELALPMGNLSNRYLLSRMGYFNPHAGDFILNLFHYVWHWMKYYALSRRMLLLPWFLGSLVVVYELLKSKKELREVPPEHLDHLTRIGRAFDLSPDEVEALGQLQSTPITQRLFRMLHELWFDRLIIALVMTGGTVALALVPIPLWIKLMVPLSTFPLIYLIYEMATAGQSIFIIEKELPERARALARVLPARLIVFGHTHIPRQVPLSRTTTFVDTGTWAPIYPAKEKGELKRGMRNYLTASFQQKKMTHHLGSWMD